MPLSHHRQPRRFTVCTTGRAQRQRGYVMVMFALLLVPLLLMVGFAVDVGYWYSRASDIRRAADAAALAGVVWLPDENAARTAALASAEKNGFVPGPNLEIDVRPSTQSDRRLQVTITDKRVGSFFYESIMDKRIDLTRTSWAEYVLSVPMGSPRNFFGTGTLLEDYTATGIAPEFLYQSVNPYCTDKSNGDRYQSGYNNVVTSGTCTGTANSEYRTSGYAMYIEAPEGRTADIDVRLYDARYNEDALTWQVQNGETCGPAYEPETGWTTSTSSQSVTLTGPAQYETRSSATSNSWSTTQTLAPGETYPRARNLIRYRVAPVTWTPSATGWTGPFSSSSTITINGLAQYQTRDSDNTSTWNATRVLSYDTDSFSRNGRRLRYRTGTYPERCVPAYTNMSEAGIDDERQQGEDNYTYTLYGADNTPLNDEDNPQICSKTFTKDTAFEYEYLGSKRWNSLCTIPRTALSGRYIVKVTNGGVVRSPLNDGSNQWGIVAKYANTGDGLCDGRNDVMCPRVFGRDAISVRAAAETSVASFYLAEIDREHAGKKLRLELFDPGEGGNNIQIMRPSGTNGNTWTPASFSWTGQASTGSTSGTNVTSIDVTQSRFNGKVIEITVDLSGYNPPSNNEWWQIKYSFSGEVTDRTTWSARIIGDPVHLVEEF